MKKLKPNSFHKIYIMSILLAFLSCKSIISAQSAFLIKNISDKPAATNIELLSGNIWEQVKAIPITKCNSGKPDKHTDYKGFFKVFCNDSGLFLQVKTMDAFHTTVKNNEACYKYDSVEFWFNDCQFIIYEDNGKPKITAYCKNNRKKQNKVLKLLSQVLLSLSRKNNMTTYRIFFPWSVLHDRSKAPDNLFAMAVGINDRDNSNYMQMYTPGSYQFRKKSSYASCKISDKQAGGEIEWDSSWGLIPDAKLGYDKEGYVALHLHVNPKLLKNARADIEFYPVSSPNKEKSSLSLNNLKNGANRIPEKKLIPKFERNVISAKGKIVLGTKEYPIASHQNLFPIKNGILTNKMQNPPPADFKEFWDKKITECMKVPIKAQISELKKNPNGSRVYRVVLNGSDGIPTVGFLTLPSKNSNNKSYPCLVKVHGYSGSNKVGAEPFDLSSQGLATYAHNMRGQGHSRELHDYKCYLLNMGVESRDNYYHLGAFLDLYRLVEFLASHPEINGNNIGFYGGSQGGGSALVAAALNKKVKLAAAASPGFCCYEITCDISKSHFPSFIRLTQKTGAPTREQVLNVMRYFDVANFCYWIKCPTLFANTLADKCTVPEGMAAAWNNIPAKEKKLFVYPEGRHCYKDENYKKILNEWITKYLLNP